MSLIDSWEVIKYVRASAGRAGLNVVFEDVNMPRHDGDTIYLPRITAKITKEQMEEMMASTDHEVGHDTYSDFEILKEVGLDPRNTIDGLLWNLLEDSRVNSLEADEYYGFKLLWDRNSSSLMQDVAKNINKATNIMGKLVCACVHWDLITNSHRFPLLAASASSFTPDKEFSEILVTFTDKLEAARLETDKVRGTKMTYDLVHEILDAFKIPKTKVVKKECKKAGETEGETEKEEGEEETENEELQKLAEALPNIKHDKKFVEKDGEPNPDSRADPSFGEWHVNPNVVVLDINNKNSMTKYRQYELHYNNYLIKRHSQFKKELRAHDVSAHEGFSQQVRRMLQIESRVRYEYGVKKGKLDQSRLSRICVKDASGFSDRVFKRRINNLTLDAAVTLLIDASGSMEGEKYLHATNSALLLNETISNALHVPVEIVSFTDTGIIEGAPPVMILHKTFDQKVSQEHLYKSFGFSNCIMQGNPDGENILWAYDRLVHRKEKKKVLIVFSDGSPAASRDCVGIAFFTKKVILEIESKKLVDIYGIGIMNNSVKELYTNCCVINKADDISNTLLQVIEQKLIKDRK
jgi:cobaltochelatase CobT